MSEDPGPDLALRRLRCYEFAYVVPWAVLFDLDATEEPDDDRSR